MHSTGLRESDIRELISAIKTFPSIREAVVFGSRAKGNFRNGSDVDLALKGESLTAEEVVQIGYLLNEESSMPYSFDVLKFETVASVELVEHIDRVGICIYSAPNA